MFFLFGINSSVPTVSSPLLCISLEMSIFSLEFASAIFVVSSFISFISNAVSFKSVVSVKVRLLQEWYLRIYCTANENGLKIYILKEFVKNMLRLGLFSKVFYYRSNHYAMAVSQGVTTAGNIITEKNKKLAYKYFAISIF